MIIYACSCRVAVSLQSAKVYKRYSSVIPSSHILNEVQEVQPGRDNTDAAAAAAAVDGLNGVGGEVQRPALAPGRPGGSNAVPKVQLRTQRGRLASRPISMPLERLAAPPQIGERTNRPAGNNDTTSHELDTVSETIQETLETDRVRPSGSSRVSTYYITPFMDTQTLQRKTWDKKYRHYDVTPRTAMIVANLGPAGSGVQPAKTTPAVTGSPAMTTASAVPATSTVSTVFSANPYTTSAKAAWVSKGENVTVNSLSGSWSSPNLALTLRQPRTLHPPPGTFYKPPTSVNSRARTLSTWTTAVSPIAAATTSVSSATAPEAVTPPAPVLASPPQTRLHTQDSTDSAIDPGASTSSTLSPPQSPPPSSPEDLSPSELKPVYQRLRTRRLQELEHREAHFV